MKKTSILKTVALITLFSMNIYWFGFSGQESFVNTTEAMYPTLDRVSDDGGGGGFVGDGGGYDFLYDNTIVDVLVVEDVEITPTVPNPTTGNVTKLTCAWDCGESFWYKPGFYAIPEMCTEGDLLIQDIQVDINAGKTGDWDGAGNWGANSVYDAGEKVSWDGVWVWKRYNITTGIGWTGWWVGLANYCEANGWWTTSNKQNIALGDVATLTFTIAENIEGTDGTYGVDLLAKDTVAGVLRMQGTFAANIITGGQTVTTPSFNSPFIYFDNVSDGAYTVALDSQWDMYQSVTPAFTRAAVWEVVASEGDITVAGEREDHLFYELAMNKIDLSRSGMNFNSKDDLVAFLEGSDFFTNLHMTAQEKDNSLGYLIPRLPDSENYYLTVLTSDAVESLSQLSVTPKPEQLVRTYYAVYPTVAPVHLSGALEYPSSFEAGKSTVKEYGEIIVKPEMYVFWK